MKFIDNLWNGCGNLLSLLTGGGSCICCGSHTVGAPLCPQCREERLFRWIPRDARCSCCGKELVSEIGICAACRAEPVLAHVKQSLPVHSYRLWKKDLLFAWKTAGMRQLSPVLASLMAEFLRKEFSDLGQVPLVPVPPRPGKIRRQGWDQIQELCRYLRHHHGFQVLPLLERRSVEQQKKLDRKGRLENLGRSYCIHEKNRARLGLPPKVILIDDILTTGVTLETCARALKEAGVDEVYSSTLFYVT